MGRDSTTLHKTSRAAAQLVSRCPPRRSRQNMYVAEELASETFRAKAGLLSSEDDDHHGGRVADFRAAFLDTMVERVDQRVEIVECPSCTAVDNSKGAFWFVTSEYNRSGDLFRCPKCHSLVGAGEDERCRPTTMPRSFVAWLERSANALLASYATLYYAHNDLLDDHVVSSCYTWVLDDAPVEDFSDDAAQECIVPSCLGIAIYILHRHRGGGSRDDDDPADETNDGRRQSQWTSAHLASVRPSVDGSKYAFQSTVMLDIVQSSDQTAHGLKKQRVHGLVATETSEFVGRPVALKASSRSSPREQLGSAIVVELCEHLQRVENALRDSMESLYIGKVGSMMAQSLRVGEPAGSNYPNATRTVEPQVMMKSVETVVATAPAPSDTDEPPPPTASLPDGWEEAQDDDGNTYYYHVETGETSWDIPAGEISDPVPHTVPHRSRNRDEAVADPLTILMNLGLTQPAEGYYKELKRYLRRFYDTKLTEETLLQLDDAEYTLGEGENGDEGEQRQVLEVLIPVYGDRRKLLKWIGRRRAELGGE